MNIFELIFFLLAIICAMVGGNYFGQWGIFSGAGGVIVGLFTPFLLSQIIHWIVNIRFSNGRK